HRRTALVLVADQRLGKPLGIVGVGAQDAVLDPFVEQRLDRLFLPFERRLAQTRQPGVGGEAHEEIVSQAGVGEERLQADNLHRRSVPEAAARGKEKAMSTTKVALVTGSGKRRVGWFVAEALAERGYAIAAHYHRSAAEAAETTDYLRAKGVAAQAFGADLAD